MRFIPHTCLAVLAALNAAGAGELSNPELKAARKLSNAKCAKCHEFYNPADYDEATWRAWMTKMNRKAKVRPEQDALLSRYFATFRDAAQAGGTNAPAKPELAAQGVIGNRRQ